MQFNWKSTFIRLVALVWVCEALVMGVLAQLPKLPAWLEAILDSTMLGILLVYPIWVWVIRPVIHAIETKANLFEQAEDAFGIVEITDPQGVISYVNENFCTTAGYSREEVLGQSHRMFKSGLHGPEFYKEMWVTIASGKPWRGEMCNRAKDGSLFWVDTYIIPVLDRDSQKVTQYFTVRHDVTATHRNLAALEMAHIRQSMAIRSLRFGIFEFNMQTLALTCDDLMFEIFGLEKSKFDGSFFFFHRCINEVELPNIEDLLQKALATDSEVSLEFGIVRFSDQAERVLRGHIQFLKDPLGMPDRAVGIVADITESREQERRLIYSSKMSSLGEMAAGISHEINNPLAIILGWTGKIRRVMVREKITSENILSSVDAIDGMANRILKIVKGLKSFSRQDNHDPHVKIAVSSIISDVVEISASRFREKQIELKVSEVAPGVTIECHPAQIEQVLINLLSNAVDACESLDEKWVQIEGEDAGGEVLIKVTDSGPGIPKEIRQKLMLPFFTTKDPGRGTGLGLSISLGIARSHGGDLLIDELCPNTRFVLRLPKSIN